MGMMSDMWYIAPVDNVIIFNLLIYCIYTSLYLISVIFYLLNLHLLAVVVIVLKGNVRPQTLTKTAFKSQTAERENAKILASSVIICVAFFSGSQVEEI